MDNFVLFLGGGSVVAFLLMEFIKKFIKQYIEPRWGDLGIQVVLFLIALLMAFGYWGFQFIPKEVLTTAGMIFSGAMIVYQVLYKSIINGVIRNKVE